MAVMRKLVEFFLILLTFPPESELRSVGDNRIVCCIGTWATYRQGEGKYEIEDVNPELCTHVIYAFAGLNDETYEIKPLDPWQDLPSGKNGYNRAVKLKEINPNLKVLLAVGGWNEGSVKYSKMASSATSRDAFVTSTLSLLETFGFDGVDLDWEFPTQRGGSPRDKENLILLLQDMKRVLHGKSKILSIAVAMGKDKIEAGYDVTNVSRSVDFINLMTYDFRGSWDGFTGHHTQMYMSPMDSGIYEFYNVNTSVHIWIDGGADKSKLNIGIAFYGHTYTVLSNNGEIGTSSDGPGIAGQYTNQMGILGYNEICLKFQEEDWETKTDDDVRAPWSFRRDQFVAYDDVHSIKYKNKWAKEMGLGGAMVWSLETDDFKGNCNQGRYPLLKTIYRIWKDEINPTTTESPSPTVTDTTKSTTPGMTDTSTDTTTPGMTDTSTDTTTLGTTDTTRTTSRTTDTTTPGTTDTTRTTSRTTDTTTPGTTDTTRTTSRTTDTTTPGTTDTTRTTSTTTDTTTLGTTDTTRTTSTTTDTTTPGTTDTTRTTSTTTLGTTDTTRTTSRTTDTTTPGTTDNSTTTSRKTDTTTPGTTDTSTTTYRTTEATTPRTTNTPGPGDDCVYGEIIPDSQDCSGYYICTYITTTKLGWVHLTCGQLYFDPEFNVCALTCPWYYIIN